MLVCPAESSSVYPIPCRKGNMTYSLAEHWGSTGQNGQLTLTDLVLGAKLSLGPFFSLPFLLGAVLSVSSDSVLVSRVSSVWRFSSARTTVRGRALQNARRLVLTFRPQKHLCTVGLADICSTQSSLVRKPGWAITPQLQAEKPLRSGDSPAMSSASSV